MKDNVARCHLIASVLAADGMIAEGEREFLHRAMDKLGLSDQEKDKVMHFEDADDAIAKARALPESERREIIDDVLEAALIDGKLSPHETETVKKITDGLGI